MMTRHFNFSQVDISWKPCLKKALTKIDSHYLSHLYKNKNWLPGPDDIFNAFRLPVEQIKYVLVGESPYPRKESANGYAFWDQAVVDIWSENGLSKAVNRATSLRNIIKMLLVAEGLLDQEHTTQQNIALINKKNLIKTNQALFANFLQHGFLLLNMSLVLQETSVQKDALAWHLFLKETLHFLIGKKPDVKLILFGKIAKDIDTLLDLPNVSKLYAEHPYNLSFINQTIVLDFFRPLHLLQGTE